MKHMIKEIIIVEGKDDVSAIKRAVHAEVVTTSGLGLSAKRLQEIAVLSEDPGVIIFTDPDFPGGKIRHMVGAVAPLAKHAYITQRDARCSKTGKVGVEYAKPEVIRLALDNAKATHYASEERYSSSDLASWGLAGGPDSSHRRRQFCERLGIGYANAKQLCNKLNHYQIAPEVITCALAEISRDQEEQL